MPKMLLARLLLLFCITITTELYAENLDPIRDYINNNFSQKLQLSADQLQQLSWSLSHTRRSFEMDSRFKSATIHMETTRALSRLYCLQLLRAGGSSEYKDFIAAQLATNAAKPLSFNSFNKLSKYIQKLQTIDYDLIQTATILSAVSLSAEATKLAKQHQTNDSLEFLSNTVRVDASIYPMLAKLIQHNPRAKKSLYILFPPQTNFRHMLYTEGGVRMFKYLRLMIKHQYITKAELDLWYAYWIVNVAGFRGHVAHQGSVYLTEPVFQAMQKMKALLDQILESPNYEPLLPYLEYRAELLGISNLPKDQKLLLAHLGSLMRLYNIEDGRCLQAGFAQLSKSQQQQAASYFQSLISDPTLPEAIFLPALLANTLELNNRNIEQTVTIIMPIYFKALQIYTRSYRDGYIEQGVSLSFNKIGATENIRKILRFGTTAVEHISVGANGEVQI